MFIRDTSIRASSAYRAFPPLFISFIRFSDFSHSTPFPFPLSNPTTTTLYYMLSNEPRKKKGERGKKKGISNLCSRNIFFFSLLSLYLFIFYECIRHSFHHSTDISRVPRRFYEGATTREPDVCVPPLYDHPTISPRNGSNGNRNGGSSQRG